jgi:hypothetical protein
MKVIHRESGWPILTRPDQEELAGVHIIEVADLDAGATRP